MHLEGEAMEQTLMLFGTFIVLPIISAICAYFYRRKVQQLPEHQRLALQQFAELAVQAIEQEHKKMLSGTEKRNLANGKIMALYECYPVLKKPTQEALGVARESAVYRLKSAKPS